MKRALAAHHERPRLLLNINGFVNAAVSIASDVKGNSNRNKGDGTDRKDSKSRKKSSEPRVLVRNSLELPASIANSIVGSPIAERTDMEDGKTQVSGV